MLSKRAAPRRRTATTAASRTRKAHLRKTSSSHMAAAKCHAKAADNHHAATVELNRVVVLTARRRDPEGKSLNQRAKTAIAGHRRARTQHIIALRANVKAANHSAKMKA